MRKLSSEIKKHINDLHVKKKRDRFRTNIKFLNRVCSEVINAMKMKKLQNFIWIFRKHLVRYLLIMK